MMTYVIAFGGKFNLTYLRGNLGYYPKNAHVLKKDLHARYGNNHVYDELFHGDGTEMKLADKEKLMSYLLQTRPSKVLLLMSGAFGKLMAEYITKHLPEGYTPLIGLVSSHAPYVIKGGDADSRFDRMDVHLNNAEAGIYYYDAEDVIAKYTLPLVHAN